MQQIGTWSYNFNSNNSMGVPCQSRSSLQCLLDMGKHYIHGCSYIKLKKQTDKTSAAKVSPTVSNMVRMSLLMVAVLLQLPVIALLRYGIQKQQIACILSSHCVL
ncbi:unnamed protein product [Urochloa humidicola]